jgi:phage baseplate assembly protein W
MTSPVYLGYPYQFDPQGRTALADEAAHLRDLIELLLFTTPGERINRPGFGSGLLRLVFEPAAASLLAAAQATVHASLQQWLGDRIEVRDVTVESEDATIRVTVAYVVRRSQALEVATFERSRP